MGKGTRDIEIASFLAGKTVKAVRGIWFPSRIELAFTDGSKIEIDSYTEYGCGYIKYCMWPTMPDKLHGNLPADK